MNKIGLIALCVLSIVLFNFGFSIHRQVGEMTRQRDELLVRDAHMKSEIFRMQQIPSQLPVALPNAFSQVINEMRYLEGNSGTSMNLTINNSRDNDDISNYYIDSQYQGVKKLPVAIQIDKSSTETDMGAVLSDIYQLEIETDFKVSEIINDGNETTVKGDVYGI